jgi:hypothetical protein
MVRKARPEKGQGESLKFHGPWGKAVKKAVRKKRPAGGWPAKAKKDNKKD